MNKFRLGESKNHTYTIYIEGVSGNDEEIALTEADKALQESFTGVTSSTTTSKQKGEAARIEAAFNGECPDSEEEIKEAIMEFYTDTMMRKGLEVTKSQIEIERERKDSEQNNRKNQLFNQFGNDQEIRREVEKYSKSLLETDFHGEVVGTPRDVINNVLSEIGSYSSEEDYVKRNNSHIPEERVAVILNNDLEDRKNDLEELVQILKQKREYAATADHYWESELKREIETKEKILDVLREDLEYKKSLEEDQRRYRKIEELEERLENVQEEVRAEIEGIKIGLVDQGDSFEVILPSGVNTGLVSNFLRKSFEDRISQYDNNYGLKEEGYLTSIKTSATEERLLEAIGRSTENLPSEEILYSSF